MENKRIPLYVVLVRAHTGLGKVTRTLFGYEYTHIAVCFDRKLEDFVTFSRRRHFAPFDAGFMHEKREHYAFGKYAGVKVKVFRLPVQAECYRKIQEFVVNEELTDGPFNFYSMVTMPLIHGFLIPGAHNCMSFVGKIIELSGVVKLKKPYYRYNIREMDELLTSFFVKEGILRKKVCAEDTVYMERVGIAENTSDFIKLNRELINRIVFR